MLHKNPLEFWAAQDREALLSPAVSPGCGCPAGSPSQPQMRSAWRGRPGRNSGLGPACTKTSFSCCPRPLLQHSAGTGSGC